MRKALVSILWYPFFASNAKDITGIRYVSPEDNTDLSSYPPLPAAFPHVTQAGYSPLEMLARDPRKYFYLGECLSMVDLSLMVSAKGCFALRYTRDKRTDLLALHSFGLRPL